MKKLIVLSLLTALVLLGGVMLAPAHAQAPAQDLKPTFISPTPGLYVNGWPAFTVSYPKEWEQITVQGVAVFSVGVSQHDLPWLSIDVIPSPLPLEEWAKIYIPHFLQLGTDLKVLSDKPSLLKDGTPAREVEFEYVDKNSGHKVNDFILMMKKEYTWVTSC
jgi:hypothetical protein